MSESKIVPRLTTEEVFRCAATWYPSVSYPAIEDYTDEHRRILALSKAIEDRVRSMYDAAPSAATPAQRDGTWQRPAMPPAVSAPDGHCKACGGAGCYRCDARAVSAAPTERGPVISHYDDERGEWVMMRDSERWLCDRAHAPTPCSPKDCTWPQCMHIAAPAVSAAPEYVRDYPSGPFRAVSAAPDVAALIEELERDADFSETCRLSGIALMGKDCRAAAAMLRKLDAERRLSAPAGDDAPWPISVEDTRLLKRLRGNWKTSEDGVWSDTDAMHEAARVLDRMYAQAAAHDRDMRNANAMAARAYAAEQSALPRQPGDPMFDGAEESARFSLSEANDMLLARAEAAESERETYRRAWNRSDEQLKAAESTAAERGELLLRWLQITNLVRKAHKRGSDDGPTVADWDALRQASHAALAPAAQDGAK